MSTTIQTSSVLHATGDQVSGDFTNGEVVILHLKDGIYYGLNRVGGRVWSLLQQPQAVKSVIDKLQEEFQVDPETCKQDVIELLQELADRGLVVACQA